MIAPGRAMPTLQPECRCPYPYTLANVGAPSTMTSAVSLRGLRKSFGDLQIIFFYSLLFYIYYSSGFQIGNFPRLMPLRWLPWMFATAGGTSIIGNPVCGRLLDRFGPKFVLLYHLILLCLAYSFVIASALTIDNIPLLFIACALFGFTDGVNTTFISSMMMKDIPNNISGALAGTFLYLVVFLFILSEVVRNEILLGES